VVKDPTRENNILDFFLTNNPSTVNSATVIQGISDHETVLIDTNTTARMKPQKPRKIHLYKKAECDDIKTHINNLRTSLNDSNKYKKYVCRRTLANPI